MNHSIDSCVRHVGVRASAAALAVILAACSASRPAPVTDTRTPSPSLPAPITSSQATPPLPVTPAPVSEPGKTHVVQKGDTLISIAFQNGLDYRELALWNNIENPNVIKLGDTLRLTPPGAVATPSPAATAPKPGEPVVTPLVITPMPAPSGATVNTDKLKIEPKATRVPYSDAALAKANAEAASPIVGTPLSAGTPAPPAVSPAPAAGTSPSPATAAPATDRIDWAWPIQPAPAAKQLIPYSELAKGVGITGTKGTPVRAAAAGKVIYTGSHIRGYGRLVIIRHTADWSSAYAHNEKIVVEEGATVKKGDKIAEMGDSDADQVKLHFEIRKNGKPVDPVKMLGN